MDDKLQLPKKRGRKPKNYSENINLIIDDKQTPVVNSEDKPKKRGRKPKGGKIVPTNSLSINNTVDKPNVILHLKCSIKDICNNMMDSQVKSFNFNNSGLSYNEIKKNNYIKEPKIEDNVDNDRVNLISDNQQYKHDSKIISSKLKQLQHNLHLNNCSDKKSACFWCTYDFDTSPIFIPKFFVRESYHVYGCFCSPECAAAYLMNENIDSSVKFERYYLLNFIYCKIYEYKKNVKPAPNPQHTLEKFYGNLSIQEYRSLFKNERLFLVVEKPLTRIMPELHEDNDDFIINNKVIPSNTYQFKKNILKTNKTTILNEKFGANYQ
jgi:hypothetical protein